MSKIRHILSLSGGKDSAALAIYLKDKIPDMEYIFNDTGKELPETYEYLDRISDYIGRPVIRLNADKGFDHWYDVYRGMIPSNHRRWCTRVLKLKPFEKYVGDQTVYNYVGLRADETRSGYISTKPNIKPMYPFIEDGLVYSDIKNILQESGVGFPAYSKWGRTRSGCFFCFYQQKIEWVNLLEEHPDLFDEAESYERAFEPTGNLFTWAQNEPLASLRKPERVIQIKVEHTKRKQREYENKPNLKLAEIFQREFGIDSNEDIDDQACLICTL